MNLIGVRMNIPTAQTFKSAGSRNHYFDTDFHELSHDLRTPLNHISGFAELLLMDESLSPAHADCVRAILTGSHALNTAVTSYLDRADVRAPKLAAATDRKAFPEALHRRRRSMSGFSVGSARDFRSFERSEPA